MQTILITVDALRADHLGQYGYHRDTFPAADALADDGYTYEHAVANGAFTRVSVPSLLTSSYMAYDDLSSYRTIAEHLSENDISTAVVGTQTGIGLVGGEFGFETHVNLGRDDFAEEDPSATTRIARGIGNRVNDALVRAGAERLRDVLKRPYKRLFGGAVFQQLGYTPAPDVTDAAINWIREHQNDPFFLWVHYMEPHRPYCVHDPSPAYLSNAPSEERVRTLMQRAGLQPDAVDPSVRAELIDMYDSDIRYCSESVERLVEYLQSVAVWDDATVLLTSDHGEEFGEHGRYFHRNYPYHELVNVPLFFKPSGGSEATTIAAPRELLDVAPTIAAAHECPYSGFRGSPLTDTQSRRPISLGQPPYTDAGCAIRTTDWTLVTGGQTTELYNRMSDPDEQNNVSDAHPETVAELEASIPSHVRERAVNPPRAPDSEVDKERLQALGYMEVREE